MVSQMRSISEMDPDNPRHRTTADEVLSRISDREATASDVASAMALHPRLIESIRDAAGDYGGDPASVTPVHPLLDPYYEKNA